jgi:CelD/BcsL family acetyltransferase involved in cellulose biosynthesis
VKTDVHESLEAVGPEGWEALHADSALRSPFLTWAWQREWLAAFGEGRRLALYTVSDDAGRLLAVLPLVETAPGRLMLTGGADVSDYLDLLVRRGHEADAWRALLDARGADRATWELHAVPAASPTVTALPELAAAAGLVTTTAVEERCPVLALPETWDAFLGALPKKHRHELTRKMRRLEREVPDARVVWETTPAGIDRRLDEFLTLHRASREGKAKFMDARMEGFFRRAIAAPAARAWRCSTHPPGRWPRSSRSSGTAPSASTTPASRRPTRCSRRAWCCSPTSCATRSSAGAGASTSCAVRSATSTSSGRVPSPSTS